MINHRRFSAGAAAAASLVFTLGTAACGSDSSSSPPAASGNAVTIKNFAFSPATLTVKVGTKVTWDNQDGSAHTATGDNKEFDTGNLAQGANGSFTFSQAATVKYHCSIHGYMTGTITVTS